MAVGEPAQRAPTTMTSYMVSSCRPVSIRASRRRLTAALTGALRPPHEPVTPVIEGLTLGGVEFRVLGPLEGVGEAGRVPVVGNRARVLLARRLLLANQVV